MPKDTRPNENPYEDKSPLPVIVAVVFLIAAACGVYFHHQDPEVAPKIDAREIYSVPEPSTLPLITEIPTLYESEQVGGRGLISETVGDRGLWFSDSDHPKKVFGLLSKRWASLSLRPGQEIKLKGKVYRSDGLNPLSLDELDADVITTIKEVEAFIYIEEILPSETQKRR